MMKEHWSKPLWEGTVVDKELQHFPTFTDWWSNSVRTDYMVRILRVIGGDTAYGQRIRLFACRCLRESVYGGYSVWDDLLLDDRCRQAVDVAERYANGQATIKELRRAGRAADKWKEDARRAAARSTTHWMDLDKVGDAGYVAMFVTRESIDFAMWAGYLLADDHENQVQQAQILREIIPNEEAVSVFEYWAQRKSTVEEETKTKTIQAP